MLRHRAANIARVPQNVLNAQLLHIRQQHNGIERGKGMGMPYFPGFNVYTEVPASSNQEMRKAMMTGNSRMLQYSSLHHMREIVTDAELKYITG